MNSASCSSLDSILGAIAAEFAPQTDHESFLVEQMADARHRVAVLRPVVEAALQAMLADPSDNARLSALSKLERLKASAERSYRGAHKDLIAARKARGHATPASTQAAAESPKPAPAPKSAPAPEPNISDYNDDELELLTSPVYALCEAAAKRVEARRELGTRDER